MSRAQSFCWSYPSPVAPVIRLSPRSLNLAAAKHNLRTSRRSPRRRRPRVPMSPPRRNLRPLRHLHQLELPQRRPRLLHRLHRAEQPQCRNLRPLGHPADRRRRQNRHLLLYLQRADRLRLQKPAARPLRRVPGHPHRARSHPPRALQRRSLEHRRPPLPRRRRSI